MLSRAADLSDALQTAGLTPTPLLSTNLAPAPEAGCVDVVVIDAAERSAAEVAQARDTPELLGALALVIGGAPDDDLWELARRFGADDALARPLDPRALAGRVHLLADLSRSRRDLAQVNEALGRRQQLTAAILDGIPSAVVVTDPQGRITFINPAACATLGVTTARCLGAGVAEVMQLPFETGDAPPASGERVKRLTYVYQRPDGAEIDIGLSMSRAEGTSLHGLGSFIIFRDLEESRQLEMNGRRVERLAAMGTMAAGFAHEVRNPLASLRILGEALEAEMDPGDARLEFVTRMMQQLERIERLVKTSLRFGRPEPPRRSRRSAAAIVAAAADAIQARTREMGGAIAAEIEAELPSVYVDDAQLVQVLITLLDNALDAAGRPQRVVLRARADGERPRRRVRFEVADEGPGIPEHLISRIFDPFFTTKASGTGLGLSIAQQIVQENGGRIEVASTPGQGAIFAVIVPGGGE